MPIVIVKILKHGYTHAMQMSFQEIIPAELSRDGLIFPGN